MSKRRSVKNKMLNNASHTISNITNSVSEGIRLFTTEPLLQSIEEHNKLKSQKKSKSRKNALRRSINQSKSKKKDNSIRRENNSIKTSKKKSKLNPKLQNKLKSIIESKNNELQLKSMQLEILENQIESQYKLIEEQNNQIEKQQNEIQRLNQSNSRRTNLIENHKNIFNLPLKSHLRKKLNNTRNINKVYNPITQKYLQQTI